MKKPTWSGSAFSVFTSLWEEEGNVLLNTHPTGNSLVKSTERYVTAPEGVGMGGCLSLDTILSASAFFVRKWSPDLARNQSRDLLRFVICRLYDQGRGKLIGTHLTLAQGTLGRKLGLSRQWVGILLVRLEQAGWIQFTAPWVGPGMRGSTVIGIGRQLKRLLVMLTKSRQGKKRAKLDDKNQWQFSPSNELKKLFAIEQKEQEPLSAGVLQRIPLLGQWLERGKSTT